jgi:hypothetical protein
MTKKSEPKRYRPIGGDGDEVSATEGTQEHVDAGQVGNVGDFIVQRDGFTAQWWERDAFLEQYELAK